MTMWGMNEADTCREYVLPSIERAGWTSAQLSEQVPVLGDNVHRLSGATTKRRCDYVLELDSGQPLIAIEAKRAWARPDDGIQQAARYAERLEAPFALSTNGRGWTLLNLVTGHQQDIDSLPGPVEAWDLFCESHGLSGSAKELVLSGFSDDLKNVDGSPKTLRYYQRLAIHKVLARMAAGEKRHLLVMATGTGKTFTAMQLVWKLWNYHRRHNHALDTVSPFRVLYLADRKILIEDPMNKTFKPVYGDSVARINTKDVRFSRNIYFATYQALDAAATSDPGDTDPDTVEAANLLNYPSDFFDLVIVDECHRGSSRESSAWRGILEHFSPAHQLGLTATPIMRGEIDTFGYFGNPVFTYTLGQGIEDGFLAPYTIRRVTFSSDADGIEILDGQVDDLGQAIPEGIYGTKEFERRLSLPDRTRKMAEHVTSVIGDSTDRAVLFCVDADHSADMVRELRNLRPDKTRENAEWAARIMTVEREKDRLLEEFTDPESGSPQVAVSTYLLTTGVDIQDLRYVVICRPVGSVAEFKQIIGRGTRLYPDKGKFEFQIIDYVGATGRFHDKDFDGPPLKDPVVVNIDADTKNPVDPSAEVSGESLPASDGADADSDFEGGVAEQGGSNGDPFLAESPRGGRTRYLLGGVAVEKRDEGFYIYDAGTARPRLVKVVDWVRERVLSRFEEPRALLETWADPDSRGKVRAFLEDGRIDEHLLMEELGLSPADGIDLVDSLLRIVWDVPQLTRAERASRVKREHAEELSSMSTTARQVMDILLDLYGQRGIDEISLPEIAQVPPVAAIGDLPTIARAFGGSQEWHAARKRVQQWLYATG